MEKAAWGIEVALCEIILEKSCWVPGEKRQVFKIKSNIEKNKDEEVEAKGIKNTFTSWVKA